MESNWTFRAMVMMETRSVQLLKSRDVDDNPEAWLLLHARLLRVRYYLYRRYSRYYPY